MTDATIFPLASLSKPITAAAVRSLVARDRLNLDSPLSELLPELNHADFSRITVRNLLQHTSGFDESMGDPLFVSGRVAGCGAAIAAITRRQPTYAPGTRMKYSNAGYCLLGRIIEQVTGMAYQDAVPQVLNLASHHRLYFGPPASLDHEGKARPDTEWRTLGAAGGWFSDASTIVKLLGDDAKDASIPAAHRHSSGNWYYGLGWRIRPKPDGYALTHFGFLPGMFSLAAAYPDGRAAVILVNGSPSDPSAFEDQLTPLLLDNL